MASMSIRGLDLKALSRLKRRAAREGRSLNSLVVRLLEENVDAPAKPRPLQKFDDLDALAGTWSSQQARAFERDTAAFSEVDSTLWKQL
jgi:plasmid stability protein